MRTFEVNPDADPDADVARRPRSALQKLFRAGAGLVIAASFGVWAYAYSGFASREAPDVLADRALVAQAEDLCATAVDDVAALPNALDAADGAERATQIRASTDRFERLVDDLEALPIGDGRDSRIYRSWLSDWRVLLEDRRDYADRISVDPDAQFYITDIGVSERLDRRVTRFANTNLMVSCAAPTDV